MGTNKCLTRLVDDVPEARDDFGSHERVAMAVVDLIESENGGKALALEGTWGSGKSTIVELIKAKLPGSVFVFDAWAHKGDPLRRAFIEELIGFLKDDYIDEKEKWREQQDTLAKRKKETVIRNTPRLTWQGTTFALLALLLPLGAAFLPVGFQASSSPNVFAILGLVFLFAPLAFLLVLVVGSYCRYRRVSSEKKEAERWAFGEIGLFLSKEVQDQRSESYETPDPTSIEFEKLFDDLLGDAVSAGLKRLVVVVDNLDRVGRDDALDMWSSLLVFLEQRVRKANTRDWLRRLWVIVPYDRPSMERLWKAHEGTDEHDTQTSAAADEPSQRAQTKRQENLVLMPQSFLQKTFVVRFRVPPLLMADWNEYLVRLLGEALPQHAKEQFGVTAGVYRQWRQERAAPTPRELKMFVNDVGALHRQWGDACPLQHLAYFVILGYSQVNVTAALLNRSLPCSEYERYLGEDATEHLCMMEFNCEWSKARSLLLKEPIENALRTGNADQLRELSEHRGFYYVFDDALQKPHVWAPDTLSISNAAVATEKAGLLDSSDTPSLFFDTFKGFADKYLATQKLTDLSPEIAQGTSIMLDVVGAEKHGLSVFENIMDLLPKDMKPDDEDKQQSLTKWTHGLVTLLDTFHTLHYDAVFRDGILIEATPEAFRLICKVFSDRTGDSRKFWVHLRPAADPTAVVKVVSPDPDSKDWHPDGCGAVKVMIEAKIAYPWVQFLSQANSFLRKSADIDAGSIKDVVHSLWRIEKKLGQAAEHLNAHVRDGIMHDLIWRAVAQGNERAAAVAVFTVVAFGTPGQDPPAVNRSQQGAAELQNIFSTPGKYPGIVKSFSELLPGYKSDMVLPRFFEHVTAWSPFARQCIEHLLSEGRVDQVVTPELLEGHYREIKDCLSDAGDRHQEYDALLETLVSEHGLANEMTKRSFCHETAALHEELLEHGGSESEGFIKWCEEGLKTVPSEIWRTELDEEGKCVGLLLTIRKLDPSFRLALSFLDGLRELGKTLLNRPEQTEHSLSEVASETLSCLEEGRKKVLLRDLRDDLVSHLGMNGPNAQLFLAVFGASLMAEDVLSEKTELVRRCLVPIVQRKHLAELKWLGKALSENECLLESFPREDVEEFRMRVETVLKGELTDDHRASLRPVVTALGMNEEDVDIPTP